VVYLTFQKFLTASLANPAATTTDARLTLPTPEIAAGVFSTHGEPRAGLGKAG